jgi:hypothetical protein
MLFGLSMKDLGWPGKYDPSDVRGRKRCGDLRFQFKEILQGASKSGPQIWDKPRVHLNGKEREIRTAQDWRL